MNDKKAMPIFGLLDLAPDSVLNYTSFAPVLGTQEKKQLTFQIKNPDIDVIEHTYLLDHEVSNDEFMHIRSEGDGEHYELQFKVWVESAIQYLGVNTISEGNCCTYSDIRIYKMLEDGFVDCTSELLPEMTSTDFVEGISTEQLPETLEYSFLFNPLENSISVSISDTPMIYDLDLEGDHVFRDLELIWNGHSFLRRPG